MEPLRVQPHEAFNEIIAESIIVLDCSCKPLELPGSAVLSASLPVDQALREAYQFLKDELSPDNMSVAVVLDDGPEHVGHRVADLLVQEFQCKRVLQCRQADFFVNYGFLALGSSAEMPVYPAEVLPGKLFLGSKLAVLPAVKDLGITHIVSLLGERPADIPHFYGSKLWCQIDDAPEADLSPAMLEALPFIETAIASGGRVLVHCEQGKSRSASVVVAFVRAWTGLGPQRALDFVQACRPQALPNWGFLKQLEEEAWNSLLRFKGTAQDPSPEPTAAELTGWVKRSFSSMQQSNRDEHEVLCSDNMSSWLGNAFMPDRIRAGSLGGLGVALEGVFSRSECWSIIRRTESFGYGRTAYPQSYRGNRRLQLEDRSGNLANAVWERIKPYLPAELMEQDKCWKPVGCNTRFRFSKYFPGDQFGAHCDAFYSESEHSRSFYTVNVYLNDLGIEQKGRTRFYKERGAAPVAFAGGPNCAGSLGLFRQGEVLHDGERLECGLKYLMRTDVMFKKF